MVECGAFVVSALAGGVLAEATSARTTNFVTLPFAAAAIVGFLRFEEPRLHRAAEPSSLRSHLALTLRTIVRVLGAVPAVCPRARLGRPRAGRAADGPSRRRAGECGLRADADLALGAGGAAIASTSRITLATSSLET
jgi:hypothetical protein